MARASKDLKKKKSMFSNFCESCFQEMTADGRVAVQNAFYNEKVSKILEDSELVECLHALFDNNLNISETSRNAFVHRNTLVYRLDKIQRITGLDARNFNDAVSLYLYMWLKDRNN